MHDRDVIERILKRITHDGSCWLVSGWDDGKGYRNISINGKTHKVHRVLFEWFWRRKLRRGIQLDHKCCNRSCCNPLHLTAMKNKKNSKLRSKRNASKTRRSVDTLSGEPAHARSEVVCGREPVPREQGIHCSRISVPDGSERNTAMKNCESLRKSMSAQIKIVEDISDLICDQAAQLRYKGFDANTMKAMRDNTSKLTKAVHEYSAYRNALETK